MDLISHLNSQQSIPGAFFAMAERHPELEVYSQPQASTSKNFISRSLKTGFMPSCRTCSFTQAAERVCKIAFFLESTGLQRGERVAIISNTRPEWMEADLAVLSLGGVVVSVYPSLTAADIAYILFDSGAQIVFVENQEQLHKIQALIGKPMPIAATEERPATMAQIEIRTVVCFETEGITISNRTGFKPRPGADYTLVPFSELMAQDLGGAAATAAYQFMPDIVRDDLATLVYTSGTTGPPKGVMQTHGNHLANVRQGRECGLYDDASRIFLFLPLAHSFAKLMGYIGYLTPARLEFPFVASRVSSKPNLEAVARDMRRSRATLVPVVPRLLEKMQEGLLARSHKSDFEAKLLAWALRSADRRYSEINQNGRAGVAANVAYLLSAPLRTKIKQTLFGRGFKYAVSGGAKLQTVVNRFFDSLGIEVLEGYGLTETCVATNVNRLGNKKIGTVGPVLSPDIEMRIADDGEIVFRGPNISKGYLNRAAATAQAWDKDGWFHTGDLGQIDADGFLKIVGRKKEIIVTAGGKKIAPEPIETRLKSCEMISQAMLFGEGKPYCIVLLTLHIDAVMAKLGSGGEAPGAPEVKKRIWAEVEAVNKILPSYETIKKMLIIDEEFTIDNGLLTPTFKVRRNEVVKRYWEQIEALYAE